MITIPRSVARTCRALFRRLTPGRGHRDRPTTFGLLAGPDGVRLRYSVAEAAVEYLHEAQGEELQVRLPVELLAECAGHGRQPVAFRRLDDGQVEVCWEHQGQQQVRTYAVDDAGPLGFPAWPRKSSSNGPELIDAFRDAVETTAREGARFALHRLLLRGGRGEVVATDGRQVLVQRCFRFPWQEDLLVPAVGVFAARELAGGGPVLVAYAGGHVLLRAGPWSVALKVIADERFPDVDKVIPPAEAVASRLTLTPYDVKALSEALPRLPAADGDLSPVTLDLNGRAVVRAEVGGRPTELVLPGSSPEGKAVRFATNRMYLSRALALGFDTLLVADPDRPVGCRDGRRDYFWMPLPKDTAVPPVQGGTPAGPPEAEAQPDADEGGPAPRAVVPFPSPRPGEGKSVRQQVPRSGDRPGKDRGPSASPRRGFWRDLVGRVGRLMDLVRQERRRQERGWGVW